MKKGLAILAAAGLCCFSINAQVASPTNCLTPVLGQMQVKWLENRMVNIVFHGHNVPSGHFKTPVVDSLHAYLK